MDLTVRAQRWCGTTEISGDVNPAGLFTKHLTSGERVDTLTRLFGCQFRGGRPAASPQLRRTTKATSQELEYVNGMLPRKCNHKDQDYELLSCLYCVEGIADRVFVYAPEGEIHDQSRLPHLYGEAERDRRFPRLAAEHDDWDDLLDWDPEAGGRAPVAYRELSLRAHSLPDVSADLCLLEHADPGVGLPGAPLEHGLPDADGDGDGFRHGPLDADGGDTQHAAVRPRDGAAAGAGIELVDRDRSHDQSLLLFESGCAVRGGDLRGGGDADCAEHAGRGRGAHGGQRGGGGGRARVVGGPSGRLRLCVWTRGI